jgi:hypothetical protein
MIVRVNIVFWIDHRACSLMKERLHFNGGVLDVSFTLVG